MEMLIDTIIESSKLDTSHRVFEGFLTDYQPALKVAEEYLEGIVESTPPAYAIAYKPWRDAVHDLLQGVYLLSKKIPLPNKEDFLNALHMFSFDGAISFLYDICKLCGINMDRNWEEKFHACINKLLFTLANLNLTQQNAIVR